MEISVTDAKAQLTDLVRRAEAGDEIVLTRHGQPAVRLVPVKPKLTFEEKMALFESVRGAGAADAANYPDAAHSQDFLYDEFGLPR